ncbi:MAG: hypothetical protein GY862_17330 [Gammaproteobacteria bacterium]|nr:hypothetical protein [Gammaproteobacteria bacterium]
MDAAYYVDLARRPDGAGHGEKSEIIAREAENPGMSEKKLWRETGKHRSKSRKTRNDTGNSKFSESDAMLLANIMWQSRRQNDKRLLTVEDGLDMMRDNGLLKTRVSTSTAFRIMRSYGIHPDQLALPEPCQTMRSLYPNHVHQTDPGVCVLYFLSERGMEWMDPAEFYKNKLENFEKIKEKMVWRHVLTDHFSGAVFVRCFKSCGETASLFYLFLMDAWKKKRTCRSAEFPNS